MVKEENLKSHQSLFLNCSCFILRSLKLKSIPKEAQDIVKQKRKRKSKGVSFDQQSLSKESTTKELIPMLKSVTHSRIRFRLVFSFQAEDIRA